MHKIGELLLRPIISNKGLYSDKVMVVLKEVLNLLIWGSSSLTNSYEFSQLLQGFEFGPSDTMASFDVSSLFTRVPVSETLTIVERRLESMRNLKSDPIGEITTLTNSGILQLLKLVLKECFFSWDGLLYKQSSGLPMGGRLSPVLANIFMEEFEYKVLSTTVPVPKMWFRYVDDVFIVWNEEFGPYDEFLDLLNKQNPNIVLTVEAEKDRKLPFLDLMVKRPSFDKNGKEQEALELSIYRKPSHCDRYIQYNSSHHMTLKRNVVYGFYLHAARLLQNYPTQFEAELQHLKKSFGNKNNGYPRHVLNRWFREFQTILLQHPEKLMMRSRIKMEEVFDTHSYQKFEFPTAKGRYAEKEQLCMRSQMASTGSGEEHMRELEWSMEEADEFLANIDSEVQDPILFMVDRVNGISGTSERSRDTGTVASEISADITKEQCSTDQKTKERKDVGIERREQGSSGHGTTGLGNTRRMEDATVLDAGILNAGNGEEMRNSRAPMMFIPFVPTLGDKLKKLAAQYGIVTRFAYPGRLNDIFTSFRGRSHLSKHQDSVYCVNCSCGLQYIGESSRNLKVRLAEHIKNSSQSAFTYHLLNNDSAMHKPVFKDTMVLARETNTTKRKVLESLCIQTKKAKVCNNGTSVNLSPVWSMCAKAMANQLSRTD